MLTFIQLYFLIYIVYLQLLIPVKSLELLIFHTSNVHGYFDETYNSIGENPVGGFARIAHILNEAKQNYRNGKGPPVLYFDSGDVYGGSPWFTIHGDKIVTALMNALEPDVACLGPAEFMLGLNGLLPYISKANFQIVVSNLDYSREPQLAKFIKEKHIITIGKTKIGILGYIKNSRLIMGTTFPTVDFLEEVEVISELAESLRKNDGVHMIIVLSHGDTMSDISLSKLVRYVDIILGGTSSTFLWNGKQPDNEKPTGPYPTMVRRLDGGQLAIAYVHNRAKYLGKLYVSYDEKRFRGQYHGQPVLLNDDIKQDKYILELLGTFRPALTEANETFLGKSRVTLDGNRCAYGECNFGNLITDSLVRFNAKRYLTKYEQIDDVIWTDAAIALINIGAIRGSIYPKKRKNNVYKLDLLTALPFNSLLYVTRISGTDLILTLEHGAKGHEHERLSSFLCVSGLKIVYDFAKPEGKRVKSVLVKCSFCRIPQYEPIQNSNFYGIVTTDYLVNSGDGHVSLGGGKSNFLFTNMSTAIECMAEYFDSFQVIAPEVEGRIIIENPIPAASPPSNFLDNFFCFLFLRIFCTKMCI